LDTLQACVLITKMQYIESWTESRRQVAQWYADALEGTDLILPSEASDNRHVYHLYVVRHPKRDALLAHLAQHKIYGGVHYPNPLFKAQPFLGATTIPWDLPLCSQYAQEILSLPMYPEMTEDHVARVAQAVRQFTLTQVTSS
jgi:dTDP-4-amino-4,6-dideoxygalactose transaminase